MDVNNQVLTFVNTYGGSENTSPSQLAASKALNYAVGPSMGNPVVELVKGIPFTIKLKGELGMSGVDNLYVKVNMDVGSLSAEGRETNHHRIQLGIDIQDYIYRLLAISW